MRDKARVGGQRACKLGAARRHASRDDGSRDYVPVDEIEPGMQLLHRGRRARAGRRRRRRRRLAISTARWSPAKASRSAVAPGGRVQAGTLNLTGPLTIEASAAARDSLPGRDGAADGGGRGRAGALPPHRRPRRRALFAGGSSDRASSTFLGWMAARRRLAPGAITIAIAVLIITCPCALGLAVPIVQVVAARRLFENGIMVKDGSAHGAPGRGRHASSSTRPAR